MKRVHFFLFFLFFYLYFKKKEINTFSNNNNNNSNMKLIFFGDCMFGRGGRPFIKNPFQFVESYLKDSSHIFFNLETTISPQLLPDKYKINKVFNYQSDGEQLISLRKITKKPIFATIVNNHTLDYGVKGYENTKNFLKDNNIFFTSKQKLQKGNIIFINATDHCGCDNPKLWEENISMIDYNNLEPIYERIRKLRKQYPKKIIVYSIHWGYNWVDGEMPQKYKEFGRKLVDTGVTIVFGHSAHHIIQNPIEEYNNGIIIYGLGDFINDYAVKRKYKSDEALMCIIQKEKNKYVPKLVKVKRKFVDSSSSIPFIS